MDMSNGVVRRGGRFIACGVLLCALGACASAPQGFTGGRIDPYRTTEADLRSGNANLPSLMEFSDVAAEQLVADLTSIPEIRDLQTKGVLELGGLVNHTGTPTGDFELIQRRVRGKLLQSPIVRDNFIVVESRRRMDAELDRVVGTQEDLLQESTTTRATAKYDPNITYLLMGDFREARRGNVRRYYMEFTLVNLGSRQTVFLKDYDLAQQ